jgi:23S rRNA (guanosine2251-2'-O)-methyltransferase
MVLDHIVDPHNLGAIARSAKAAGMTGLVAATRRAAPFSATAFKAAAGAFETLPVAMVSSIAEALRRLNQLGVWTVGLDAGGSQELFGLELLSEPVAIVVGAEGAGLSQLVRDRLEVIARIDLAPEVESLNVSVAAALAAFEIRRLRDLET